MEYELETGWLRLFYQPIECVGDTNDDPLLYDPDVVMINEPFSQPTDLPFSHTIFESGDPSSFKTGETATTDLSFSHPIYEYGEPSSFTTMGAAMTELPFF